MVCVHPGVVCGASEKGMYSLSVWALLRNLQLKGPMLYTTPVHHSSPKFCLRFRKMGRSDAFSSLF